MKQQEGTACLLLKQLIFGIPCINHPYQWVGVKRLQLVLEGRPVPNNYHTKKQVVANAYTDENSRFNGNKSKRLRVQLKCRI